MKEIVNRLHENRQIELAKSILESSGYKVAKKSKRLKESFSPDLGSEDIFTATDYIESAGDEPHELDINEAIKRAAKMLHCDLSSMLVIDNEAPAGVDFEVIEQFDKVSGPYSIGRSGSVKLSILEDPDTGVRIASVSSYEYYMTILCFTEDSVNESRKVRGKRLKESDGIDTKVAKKYKRLKESAKWVDWVTEDGETEDAMKYEDPECKYHGTVWPTDDGYYGAEIADEYHSKDREYFKSKETAISWVEKKFTIYKLQDELDSEFSRKVR